MDETQDSGQKGPLPRSRVAVDWWLKKWNRQAVIDGQEPMTREDVERLIEANGGTAEGLHLASRDMGGVDLQEVDLRSANLEAANLQGTHLNRANLQGTQLAWAILQGTQLAWANLQGANLLHVNLHGARLVMANLQGACLAVANLQGANLLKANLQSANLLEANLQDANLEGANLQGARLERSRISPDTNFEDVTWDKDYISVLEREGYYEAAISLYRRLKEWYDRAGMLTIAGEFHYREREATRKLHWQRLRNDFGEYPRQLAGAWQKFRNKQGGI
jgi:hypothetical protein